jgi:hypothetical protein
MAHAAALVLLVSRLARMVLILAKAPKSSPIRLARARARTLFRAITAKAFSCSLVMEQTTAKLAPQANAGALTSRSVSSS